MNVRKAFLALVIALALFSQLQTSQAQRAAGKPKGQASRQKLVKVYFYHEKGEYIDLKSARRAVSAASPARAALEALLAGPTPQEERGGYVALASANEFGIGSLRISGGTARVNFVSSRTWAGWPGDLAPIRFKTAVELTLKQFPNVRRVVVSLDGNPNFASAES